MTSTAPAPDRRIAEAEAYVASRFFPPLPREYGALAVQAVDAVNAGDETPIDLPQYLNPKPREAYVDLDRTGPEDPELWVCDPRVLVDILHLHHLIESQED